MNQNGNEWLTQFFREQFLTIRIFNIDWTSNNISIISGDKKIDRLIMFHFYVATLWTYSYRMSK